MASDRRLISTQTVTSRDFVEAIHRAEDTRGQQAFASDYQTKNSVAPDSMLLSVRLPPK